MLVRLKGGFSGAGGAVVFFRLALGGPLLGLAAAEALRRWLTYASPLEVSAEREREREMLLE